MRIASVNMVTLMVKRIYSKGQYHRKGFQKKKKKQGGGVIQKVNNETVQEKATATQQAQIRNDFKTSAKEWRRKMCHAYTTEYHSQRTKICCFQENIWKWISL